MSSNDETKLAVAAVQTLFQVAKLANDPCPCGSGKKYNHCHGKLT